MPVADAQHCERILRTHSRTFYLASLFLPPEKRRGALALYAFCRLADDIVDDATIRGSSTDDVRRRLDAHARGLDRAFRGRPEWRARDKRCARCGVLQVAGTPAMSGSALQGYICERCAR